MELKRKGYKRKSFRPDVWSLSELTLKNFMCYRDSVSIPLRPLVMLFGNNNSGKSAILKGMKLVSLVARSGGEEFYLDPYSKDLGSFDGLVHRGSSKGESDSDPSSVGKIEIGLELTAHEDLRKYGRAFYSRTNDGQLPDMKRLRISWEVESVGGGRQMATALGVVVDDGESVVPLPKEISLYYLMHLFTKRPSKLRFKDGKFNVDSSYDDRFESFPEGTREQLHRIAAKDLKGLELAAAVFEFVMRELEHEEKSPDRSTLLEKIAKELAPHSLELAEIAGIYSTYHLIMEILDESIEDMQALPAVVDGYELQSQFQDAGADWEAVVSAYIDTCYSVLQELRMKLPFVKALETGQFRFGMDCELAISQARADLKTAIEELSVDCEIPNRGSDWNSIDFHEFRLGVVASALGVKYTTSSQREFVRESWRNIWYRRQQDPGEDYSAIYNDTVFLKSIPAGDVDRMYHWLQCYTWTFPRPIVDDMSYGEVFNEVNRLKDYVYATHPPFRAPDERPLRSRANILDGIITSIAESRNLGSTAVLKPLELLDYVEELAASLLAAPVFVPEFRELGTFYYSSDREIARPSRGQSRRGNQEELAALEDWKFSKPSIHMLLSRVLPGYSVRSRYLEGMPVNAWAIELSSKGGSWVSIAHSGSGVSQMIPVLQCLSLSDIPFRSIQQPELHLHPQLQASLMEVMFESVLHGCLSEKKEWEPERHHKYRPIGVTIVETHSELMVLRLKKLLRKYYNQRGLSLSAHIGLMYVSNDGKNANVAQIALGESGAFEGEWPGGFFSERLDELL